MQHGPVEPDGLCSGISHSVSWIGIETFLENVTLMFQSFVNLSKFVSSTKVEIAVFQDSGRCSRSSSSIRDCSGRGRRWWKFRRHVGRLVWDSKCGTTKGSVAGALVAMDTHSDARGVSKPGTTTLVTCEEGDRRVWNNLVSPRWGSAMFELDASEAVSFVWGKYSRFVVSQPQKTKT